MTGWKHGAEHTNHDKNLNLELFFNLFNLKPTCCVFNHYLWKSSLSILVRDTGHFLSRCWALLSDKKDKVTNTSGQNEGSGLGLEMGVKSLDIRRELGVEPLLPGVKRSQQRCLRNLIVMSPVCIPLKMFQLHPCR